VDILAQLREVYESGMTFCLRLLPNGTFEISCGDYLHAERLNAVAETFEEAVTWLNRCANFGSHRAVSIHR
jgi:hypothetical protein